MEEEEEEEKEERERLEAINHVSIYFRRVARPVSWPSVSLHS